VYCFTDRTRRTSLSGEVRFSFFTIFFLNAIMYTYPMFDAYYDAKLAKKGMLELRDIKRYSTSLADNIHTAKHVYIIGICGTAMGALALMLRDSGVDVTGSDISFWAPMGPLLKQKGVRMLEGWNADHITSDVDLVIVGNACGPQHIEVMRARELQKPLVSMPELMSEYYVGNSMGQSAHKESFVVAGTHGKTTTTGILSHVLTELGLDPTYIIGGVMQSTRGNNGTVVKEGTSHAVGKGQYVVFEGDEYDTAFFDARPKFLHYRPSSAIITSVEWDHIDIYPDEEVYTTAFQHLIEVTKKHLIVSHTYPLLNQLIAKARAGTIPCTANILVYGIDDECDLRPVFTHADHNGQHFELYVKGESYGMYTLPLYGMYNVLNAVAALGLLMSNDIDIQTEYVRKALATFPGMKRRQEMFFEHTKRNIVVIDDFAHHPTAVAETLKGVRMRYPSRRVVAFFEPRSSTSRRKIFEHTYPTALAHADVIAIKVPPFKPEVDSGKDLLNPEIVKKETEALHKQVYLSNTAQALTDMVCLHIADGDVIVVMSNGSFDGIHDMLVKQLSI
jgi:UDP-N-acetylmuramate: L-alanyl-gamma-D-glutamyl-meso-diaminopimelate ligase